MDRMIYALNVNYWWELSQYCRKFITSIFEKTLNQQKPFPPAIFIIFNKKCVKFFEILMIFLAVIYAESLHIPDGKWMQKNQMGGEFLAATSDNTIFIVDHIHLQQNIGK